MPLVLYDSTEQMLRTGVSGPVTPSMIMPFDVGGAGVVTSEQPFDIQAPYIGVTNVQVFDISGNVSATSVQPFDLGEVSGTTNVQPFDIVVSAPQPTQGVPQPNPVVSFYASLAQQGNAGMTTIVVNTSAGITAGTTIEMNYVAPSPSQTPPPPEPTPGINMFGMTDHLMWHPLSEAKVGLDRMAAAGMGWVRFDLSWRHSETADNTYGTSYLNQFYQTLDYIQLKGMRAIVTVIEAPTWANSGAGLWEMDTLSTRTKYAEFMGYVAGQTASRPNMTWEIWNEENDPNFWTGGANVANFTNLLSQSYDAIKAADSDAVVLNGGILYGDTAFLEGVYSNGGGSKFDGLAIHPYCKTYSPTDKSNRYFSLPAQIEDFRTKLDAHGQSNKKIYLTEWGWGIGPTQFPVPETTRSAYTAAAVPVIRGYPSVVAACLYVMQFQDFPEYGLWTGSPPTTPKPTWTSYANAVVRP